jgi:hypothetical protein
MNERRYRDIINGARNDIQKVLSDTRSLNDADAAVIALTYGEVIGKNFLPWMKGTGRSAISNVAREATFDNIRCEEEDDHPGMLRTFVAPVTQRATPEVKAKARAVVDELAPVVAQLTRLCEVAPCGIHLMALLENTAVDFIAWMYPNLADRFDLNRTYLNVHGVADQAHADAFVTAFEAERGHVEWRREIDETTDLAVRLLTKIFTSHKPVAAA